MLANSDAPKEAGDYTVYFVGKDGKPRLDKPLFDIHINPGGETLAQNKAFLAALAAVVGEFDNDFLEEVIGLGPAGDGPFDLDPENCSIFGGKIEFLLKNGFGDVGYDSSAPYGDFNDPDVQR